MLPEIILYLLQLLALVLYNAEEGKTRLTETTIMKCIYTQPDKKVCSTLTFGKAQIFCLKNPPNLGCFKLELKQLQGNRHSGRMKRLLPFRKAGSVCKHSGQQHAHLARLFSGINLMQVQYKKPGPRSCQAC